MVAVTFVLTCVASERLFSHETLTTTVLFDREIVRVLNQHCVMCHARGGPSFPLETYEETWLAGRKMRADVIARHMPPWAAVAGYGHFANDNSLTLRESQFVVSWVEGLGPRNGGVVFANVADPAARPRPVVRAQPKFGQWDLGDPDLTVPLPPTTIGRDREPGAVTLTVDLGLTSERRIRAVQFMPGDRRVVRAASFVIQQTGQWIGCWTPWYGFMQFPEGTAVRVPPGAHVLATIYYQHTTEPVVDRGTLGLSFANGRSNGAISDLALHAGGEVTARAAAQRFSAETVLPADTALVGIWPELQPGIISLELAAKRPDGSTDVLLFAKDIPTDWPTPYIFKQAVTEPRGTRLTAVAYYGNRSSTALPGGFAVHLSTFPKVVTPIQSTTTRRASPAPQSASAPARYALRGKVVSVDRAGGKLIVDHQPIPGLMGAMTMAYGVKDGRVLERLSPGDAITANVLVGGGQYTLENVAIVPSSK